MSEEEDILLNQRTTSPYDQTMRLQARINIMTVEMDELYRENKKMHECLVKVLNYLSSPEDQEAEFIERLICEALKQYHIKP
jgi:hypothetical protein